MELIKAVILGLTQGLTEFIPVSSSGHLILVGHFLHFKYSGLAFDTSLDIGTLAALFIFFWRDFWGMAHDFFVGGPYRKLATYIIIGTIPAVLAGLVLQKAAETVFRNNALVAFNLIWVAVVMLVADQISRQSKKLEDVTLKNSLIIGLVQCFALVPGVSRSGSTITAGRFLGFDRVAATRFSFLLSAPIILGATLKVLVKHSTLQQIAAAPSLYLAGIVAAFVAGYLAIKFLINYLGKHGLAIFAYYRIVAGVIILLLVR